MFRYSPARRSWLLLATFLATGAYGQSSATTEIGAKALPLTAQEVSDTAAETQMRVNDAIVVVEKLKTDPRAGELLAKAKGAVIVPHYMQAALIFGGRTGSGVLLVRRARQWSDPVFYRISGGTFGAQIGGTKGALVMLLMSDKAVDAFENKPSTWSLSAGAGLNAIRYSKQAPESETLSDVVVWSDTKGLFGGAAVGATKVSRDTKANQVYYSNPDVTAQEILSGAVTNPDARSLLGVMPRSFKQGQTGPDSSP